MKKNNIILMLIASLFFFSNLFSQTTLDRIGQTPGGAGHHVNYDSLSQRLFVGAGTSLWVYDMSDPNTPVILGKRPFLGLITETILYNNNVLFVSATFDGVYAIDLSSEDLPVIDHQYVDGIERRAAYDMTLTGDTLLIPNYITVSRFKYTDGVGFTSLSDVGPNILQGSPFCITEKGNFVAIGTQTSLFAPNGKVFIYNKNNLSNHLAVWESTDIKAVSKLRFSDMNDSIIYVCGGSSDAGLNSHFFAIQFEGSGFTCLDTFSIAGLPLYCAANIQNMDSRNDTLYIATGCSEDLFMGAPLSYVPIFNAAGLPALPMEMIDYLNAGLWYFDVALMDGTPYMATASEWLGVAINDITTGNPLDTLMLIETGGWTQESKVTGDTLWVAHEGWGLAAYNIDSLMFSNGNMTDSKLLHLYTEDGIAHYFVGDFEFIDDTLLVLSGGQVFNIKPWQQGGQPDSLYKLNLSGYLDKASTNAGERILVGTQALVFPDYTNTQKMSIYDPYNPSGSALNTISILNNVKSITVVGDTVFYGFRTDSLNKTKYLVASKIVGDSLILIDSIATDTSNHINSISIDNNIVAIGKTNKIMWYSWDGSEFTYIDSYFNANMVEIDIFLKNNYIYIADIVDGLVVIDINAPSSPVAIFEGRGRWKNMFGSESITLDEDGRIYLSDFNAGVIIIEAFDTTITSHDHAIYTDNNNSAIIYPNPATTELNISVIGKKNVKTQVSIYNILGKKVLNKDFSATTNISVDISGLTKGVYITHVTLDNISFKKKFVKQ